MKRHARKGKRWIVKHYFTTVRGKHWKFYCMTKDKEGQKKPLYLKIAADTKIRRHVKIRSEATVFNPLCWTEDYSALLMRELYAVKVARTVLRRRSQE